MSSPLTNDFNNILDVAKTLSSLVEASVSIHPRMQVKNGQVEIEACHLCAIPSLPTNELEGKLSSLDFLLTGSREKDGFVWDEWGREGFFVSLGRRI